MINKLAIALVALSTLCGCGKHEEILPPEAIANPNPIKRHKIVLTIVDPPGSVTVFGEASYAIANRGRCVPVDRRNYLNQRQPYFTRSIALPIKKLSENTYELVFYEDAYLDGDYYGKGYCRWTMGRAGFNISLAGVTYHVSNSNENYGDVVAHSCRIRKAIDAGHESCKYEVYAKNKGNYEHFTATLVAYKEY